MSAMTFTMLRDGSWGVKGPAYLIRQAIENDATVTVSRRGGEQTDAMPAKVLWSGNGMAIATLTDAGRAGGSRRSSSQSSSMGECYECGQRGPAGRTCHECHEGSFV